MIGEPQKKDWIIPGVFCALLASFLVLLLSLHPDSARWSPWVQASILFSGLLLILCFLVTLAEFVRWAWNMQEQMFYKHKESAAITPLRRAAEAVRSLTPEQAELIPRFMPDDQQVVFVEQEKELVAHFYTEEGLIPWDFIETFLLSSNNVQLMKIGDTNDKTPERVFAQAMTKVMIRKGWAVPSNGPSPAMWNPGGRDRAANFFQVRLRQGTGYIEQPETISVSRTVAVGD